MSDSTDTNLPFKKRARRRLIGAVAFAGLAAVVLPMVMDEEPKQQVQDVQIRIPGQEQTPFVPKLRPVPAAVSGEKTGEKASAGEKTEAVAVKPADNKAEKNSEKTAEKPAEKAAEKASAKATEKAPEKTVEKAAEKAAEKPHEKPPVAGDTDPHRAAAILSGKTPPAASVASAAPAAAGGQYVILIGAFSNPANVKQLQVKLGEMGIKVYTEPLDSPDGKKTRVRAGPFPSRDAADAALAKMKRIGVSGPVSVKQ
jgi:DedD protein